MSELSQAPTDDEREALVKKLILESLVFVNSESEPWAQMLANRILSALRRPAQTEPSHECSWACGVNKYGADEHAQTEPTAIQFSARQGGKSQALIDSMLTQANERGIRVEVVYPQSEPTDAQVLAALNAGKEADWRLAGYMGDPSTSHSLTDWDPGNVSIMRAALKAAFTAGQEEREALAEAWDEGYIQRMYDYPADEDERINPYRIVTAGQEEQS